MKSASSLVWRRKKRWKVASEILLSDMLFHGFVESINAPYGPRDVYIYPATQKKQMIAQHNL